MNTTPEHPAIPSTRHVPVRAIAGFGPANIPLSEAPTVALAFALGAAVSTPQRADRFGPFCAMVEELAARKVPGAEAMAAQSIMGSWDASTELGALLAVPVGRFKPVLGAGRFGAEQLVVAVEAVHHRLGDVDRKSVV